MIDRLRILRWIFAVAVADAFAAWLLILLYLTGLDLIWGVNLISILILALLALSFGIGFRVTWFSSFFLFFIVAAVVKGMSFADASLGFEVKHLVSYFYGLLMPFLALAFTAAFHAEDHQAVLGVVQRYARRYALITFPGIIVYALFYFSGQISYFGLGSNLHYIYPFFLVAQKKQIALVFLAIILLSGKRAVLMNYLTQTVIYFWGYLSRRPLVAGTLLIVLVGVLSLAYQHTSFLDRFGWFLRGEIDFTDNYLMYVAFGGRIEELLGIYDYFQQHPGQLLFGAPPGAYYIWDVSFSDTGYLATKNYAHISAFGFIFRYGLLYTAGLYAIFVYILVRYWRPSDPFYLVFVGILAGTAFGASLIIDPVNWLFIGLLISLRQTGRTSNCMQVGNASLPFRAF